MNTLPHLQKQKSPLPFKSRKPNRPENLAQGILLEAIIKLVANGILATVVIITLSQLLPSYYRQQAKLKAIKGQVQKLETRLNQLSERFSSSFAYPVNSSFTQQETLHIKPQTLHVVWSESQVSSTTE